MKWTCLQCKAINPEFSHECHYCHHANSNAILSEARPQLRSPQFVLCQSCRAVNLALFDKCHHCLKTQLEAYLDKLVTEGLISSYTINPDQTVSVNASCTPNVVSVNIDSAKE